MDGMPRLMTALLVVALLTSCSGGDTDEPADAAPTGIEETEDPLPGEAPGEPSGGGPGGKAPGRPTESGSLAAGRYHTSLFEPRAVFKVGKGWEASFEEPDSLTLLLEPEPRDQAIYLDSSQADLSIDEVLRFVKQTFTGATGERRNFRFSSQASTPVGEIDGEGFTMEVLADQPVVTLELGTEAYEVKPGDKLNIRALDANGTTVLVFVEAAGTEFDAFRPKAERVLSTLSFR
jgi:hypothetical protein